MARPSVKEQIVEAGMKCLLEKGFNGVGVQEITAAAGVPKGSFYNHFESKEALGAEVIDRYAATNPRRAILRDTSRPPLERLRAYFKEMNKTLLDSNFGRGCILGNMSAELANQSELIRGSLVNYYAGWTQALADTITEAQAAGEIKNKAPAKELAAFILDAYEGALLRARVEQSNAPFERFTQLAIGQILI
jgi:TetR/AcrR family transcriptional repressor of nem operon